MKIALLAKNKLGFVDGTRSKESLPNELGYQWEKSNVIVLSWILNTVSMELSAGIVFASSVVAIWNDIGECFHKADGSRLRLFWDEYDALVPFSSCGCDQSRQKVEHVLEHRLFQFLMGLINDSASNGEVARDIGIVPGPQAPMFTQTQYQKILSLLNKEPTTEVAASLAGPLKWKDEGNW
ncbi:hypothetical protein PVK06_012543 [Gossypium arboreum]|uniref:Uncharacterized protein n=1 Tax=Gossypium arboreum TaxID=29729 RepID=A0ABR0QBS9_GOSAR|nr:hypothetical protein PVK06_012543 [Gossypium arboreum]